MTHQSWIDTLDEIVEKFTIDTAIGDLANFCSEVLKRCGDTPELKQYIDDRTLQAFEKVEAERGS